IPQDYHNKCVTASTHACEHCIGRFPAGFHIFAYLMNARAAAEGELELRGFMFYSSYIHYTTFSLPPYSLFSTSSYMTNSGFGCLQILALYISYLLDAFIQFYVRVGIFSIYKLSRRIHI